MSTTYDLLRRRGRLGSLSNDRYIRVCFPTLHTLFGGQIYRITSFTPYPISDSIWLAHGSFLIAAGQQMFLFSEPSKDDVPLDEKLPETLIEYVSRQNGPLVDYHPQMLLQCMLWGEFLLPSDMI